MGGTEGVAVEYTVHEYEFYMAGSVGHFLALGWKQQESRFFESVIVACCMFDIDKMVTIVYIACLSIAASIVSVCIIFCYNFVSG